jgi:hypothetical protein
VILKCFLKDFEKEAAVDSVNSYNPILLGLQQNSSEIYLNSVDLSRMMCCWIEQQEDTNENKEQVTVQNYRTSP